MPLQNLFHKFVHESAGIPAGSRVLVAVSGGADSVALLALLCGVAKPLSLHLEAAHLDHALRETSPADARFVEQLCLDFGVPLTLERRPVAAIARDCRRNLEEVAREVRRDFLASTARARNCPLIALGHHADDQAETFLMRLLRGSGQAGLAGMRVCTPPWVRPLLPFQRAELLDYLRSRGLDWREDESNRDLQFTRNRIRHQLLPHLESFNPVIARQLAGLCEQLGQDEQFWAERVDQELASCGLWRGETLVLNRAHLLKLAPALAGRVLRGALQRVRGDLRGLTSAHIKAILMLIGDGVPQRELCLPRLWVARRYENLWVCRRKPPAIKRFEVSLAGSGHYPLPDGSSLQLTLEHEPGGETAGVVEFAAGTLSFPLQVRQWRPGDRLRPSGMQGSKKLQDLFVDYKMTREERQRALLLLQDEEVLWVVGLRRAEGRWPVAGEAVLRIAFRP